MPSATVSTSDKLSVILVSTNFSQQMGGEAIKAFQIYQELVKQGVDVHQITHVRVKAEMDESFPGMSIAYVEDTKLQKLLYRIKPLQAFQKTVFFWIANRRIAEALRERPGAVVHFTSPVSPVIPYFRVPGATVVIGPLNGNIHYPPTFYNREPMSYRLRRWTHPLLQFLHRLTNSGKQNADAILVSGGERTFQSLRMAGCKDSQLIASIDSGVLDRLYEEPRATHTGRNLRFFQNGRLVVHKGTDMAIRALTRTKNPVELDIIGRGPELEGLKALVTQLGLGERVKFIEWIPDHSKLAEMLRQYRAFVFPSLAEANGIVVQEAMVMGLPVIALDWGGPALLVTPETGILIEPRNEEYVINELAHSMDRLAEDGALAESMSIAARKSAVENGFLWSGVIRNWSEVYHRVLAARSRAAARVA
jgi:glycosyltransferase involved in cell wall biosynthesis